MQREFTFFGNNHVALDLIGAGSSLSRFPGSISLYRVSDKSGALLFLPYLEGQLLYTHLPPLNLEGPTRKPRHPSVLARAPTRKRLPHSTAYECLKAFFGHASVFFLRCTNTLSTNA